MNERANDPVQEWLGAYLDGELTGERRDWVENHLPTCADCRQELESLRALSSLLHAGPEPAPVESAQDFAARVMARLDNPRAPRWEGRARKLLVFVPLALFVLWAVSQTALWVSGVLVAGSMFLPGNETGLLGVVSGGAGDLIPIWLSGFLSLTGLTGIGETLEQIAGLAWFPLLQLLMLGGFGMLFLAWLATLWTFRRAEQA